MRPLSLSLSCVLLLVMPLARAQQAPPCSAGQLSLAQDPENGAFDGMSHSGTLLVLRNFGTAPCSVPAFPRLTFSDEKGPLAATATVKGAQFLHPGPVALPLTVAPGAELSTSLRWVSGEVFDQSVCIAPTHLRAELPGGAQTIPFAGRLCGDRAKGVTYEMTRWAPDPAPPR